MKRILIVLVGMSAMAGLGTASAADLPRQAPMYKAPAYMAPINNWTAIYVGLNAGGGWGSSKWTGLPADFNVSGGLVGGTLGYNWQFGTWIVGVEGDLDWSNIKGSTNCLGLGGAITTCETRNSFLSTMRGRVGYSVDRWLPYVTGGAAIGNIKVSSPGFSTVDNTNVGWTIGAGVEYAFAPNWSVKAEYLYVDLGDVSCGTGAACSGFANGGNRADFTTNVVRGGVNFRF